ncbi:M20 family metallopeptidase [Fusibacter sp. 3D3]|uniref:M20 family metallopeptidase n=1 Tax=Fusibacter sp. 3D3 TaxID=1048380 RepID=UPI000853DCD4|nr:M20 family metallopeptidase [Fusibacter sp. 3D3]GAU77840.1 acetylornithine deacetylase [Fusibacter sp. 3D3]
MKTLLSKIDWTVYYNPNEVYELAQKLVQIPSHKDVPTRERDVALFIKTYCEQNGLQAKLSVVEGERYNVYITLKGNDSGKTLLFNGHTDTVPPYEMTVPPFEGMIKEGYLWGRGCNDMKGALAAMITAMLAIKRSDYKLKGDIILAAVVGEEEQSDGTEQLVLEGIKADGAIVGEPSNYEYAIGHRGLEWLEFEFIGKAAHGGVPKEGINAISMASKFIEAVERDLMPQIELRTNAYMGPSVMNFGKITGGTQPSTVADQCFLQIDRRYVTGETVISVMREYQEIIDQLKAEIPEFQCEMKRMPSNMMKQFDHMYHYTSPEEAIVKSVEKVLESHLTEKAMITRKRGWTDAATLSYYGKIPTVITGPGDIKDSHTKAEKISLKSLNDYVVLYAEIALDFLK